MAKTYLIIGGTSGIGSAITQQLLKENHQLILASRNKPSDLPDDVQFQEIDVTTDFELDLPEQLDGLVYCPGTINLKPFHRLKIEEFEQDFQVNHIGAVKVIQQALKSLKNADSATIVLFSTVAVNTGLSFHTSVASAKGAVEGLAKALAAELAPKIRVNIVAPSLTDTPLAQRLLSSEDKKQANAERHPLKSIGSAEDMANAACYLLTDKSRWITGQVLTVDGGMSNLR